MVVYIIIKEFFQKLSLTDVYTKYKNISIPILWSWLVVSDSCYFHGGELTDYQSMLKLLSDDSLGIALCIIHQAVL